MNYQNEQYYNQSGTISNNGTITVGAVSYGNIGLDYVNQQNARKFQQAALSMLQEEKRKMYSGTKPLIVVGGVVVAEAKDMDEAQRLAEEHAHKSSANAYILKPVKMVAPKRDVVTTDL